MPSCKLFFLFSFVLTKVLSYSFTPGKPLRLSDITTLLWVKRLNRKVLQNFGKKDRNPNGRHCKLWRALTDGLNRACVELECDLIRCSFLLEDYRPFHSPRFPFLCYLMTFSVFTYRSHLAGMHIFTAYVF